MYPNLQSAPYAEAVTLAILLAGAVLLYRSFREKYLVPWIAGWAVYSLYRLFQVMAASHAGPGAWAGLAIASFAVATGLFSAAIFYYVGRPRLLLPAAVATAGAVVLGLAQSLWLPDSQWLQWSFFICWRLVVWAAALQLAIFARGRGIPRLWLLTVMLLFLHMDTGRQSHFIPAFDILVDLLLGISMMMVVLDDSRAQISRLNVLNRIDRVISESDEFYPIVDAALEELMQGMRAKCAWFRVLKDRRLSIAVHRGMDETSIRELQDIDSSRSVSGLVLRTSEIRVVPASETLPEVQLTIKQLGIHHMVVIPVSGKNSSIGVLVLAQGSHRAYTPNEFKFLKAAANQLGLAAENRQLVQQLVQSRNEWASTFSSIQDYVLVHDPHYRILRANQALLDRLKRSYVSVVLQQCEAVLPGGGVAWKSCPYCEDPLSSGEEDPCFGGFSVVSSSAYSGQDSPGGTVHVIKDVTGERAAEERYKTLFDHMHEGVFASSPDGKILDCNEAFVRMLGFLSRGELLAQEDAAGRVYVNLDDRRKFQDEMAQHGFVRNFEYVLRRQDGRLISVIESSFATRGTDGSIERYQGVLLDVTEKKQAEDEIRRRNRELYVLNNIAVTFNQSFDLDEILQLSMLQIVDLFSTDTAAVYLFDEESGSIQRKAGYGHRSDWVKGNEVLALPAEFLETMKARKIELLSHHDLGPLPETIKKIIAEEGLKSWLWVVLWRKEKLLGILGTSNRTARDFSPSEESVLLAVGRQLATTIEKIQLYEETRKAYDDLRRTQEQLLQSEKMSAVGQMISGVAHELNNPLTAIIGYAQLLESEQIDPHSREFVVKLHKQAQRTQKIVSNLLSFSRQHKPQRVHVDLRTVMEETIALRDFELRAHDIIVERNFDPAVPLVVADPHQMEQVYLNIMNNAADAMLEKGQGGVLRISIFPADTHVVCEFHDSGPGLIDPKRVFDPFYTTKGVGKGTGLGLSICYGIVKEHGGDISAHNHPGGGAVIRVRIPAVAGQKPMTEGERIAARREPKLEGRVLLVDDDQEAVDFEREVLTEAGLSVVTATPGASALVLLQHESFDVVFIDSKLPVSISSQELFRWIEKNRPELAPRTVLLLADDSDAKIKVFAYSNKILCLVKPVEVSDLMSVVRRVLRDMKAANHVAPGA